MLSKLTCGTLVNSVALRPAMVTPAIAQASSPGTRLSGPINNSEQTQALSPLATGKGVCDPWRGVGHGGFHRLQPPG